MMIDKRFASLLCLAVLLGFFGQPAQAQLTRIGVGYSAISGDALPAWIAKDAGIFEKNGLDVQLVFFTGGTTAVMALVSADTPITQLAGAAVVNSVMAGSDAVLIAGGVTSLNYYLLARPDIKTPEQLKGGSVAISRVSAHGCGNDAKIYPRASRYRASLRQVPGGGGAPYLHG
jgi:NitT/TauT family transport system substrate-binding protein